MCTPKGKVLRPGRQVLEINTDLCNPVTFVRGSYGKTPLSEISSHQNSSTVPPFGQVDKTLAGGSGALDASPESPFALVSLCG